MSAPGIFGAVSRDSGDLEAIRGRLSESRRRSVRSIPTDFYPSGTGLSARGDHPQSRWHALLSRSSRARVDGGDSDQAKSDSIIVSFTGHLTNSVACVGKSTESPEALVRAAYRRWGKDCFSRLHGNFALAILDTELPALLVARDAAGTKSVFYSFSDKLVFGSSAMEVAQAAGRPIVANPRELLRYLIHGTTDGEEETLLQNIRTLPGAHYLEAVPGAPPRLHAIQYCLTTASSIAPEPFERSSEQLRQLLLESVRAQSFGTQVGVPLSGGVDSSGIIACLRASLGASEPLQAFTFVHNHPALPHDWDERPWAELAASRARATLHPVRLEASAIPGLISRVVRSQDFPFGSPVVLAQAELFRVAADHGIQIMLSGHGPDVLFGGGTSHVVARASELLRSGRIPGAWSLLRGASSGTQSSLYRLVRSSLRHALPRRAHADDALRPPPWAQKSWFRERIPARTEGRRLSPGDPMRRLILDQFHRSVLPTPLHAEECNSSVHGIENRLPYLVTPILDFSGLCPAAYLVSDDGRTKHILRSALRGLVPDAILDRRNLIGFAVPARPWLHELRPWVERRLTELRQLPFYMGASKTATWAQLHRTDSVARATAYRTWRWLTLLEWTDAYDVRFE